MIIPPAPSTSGQSPTRKEPTLLVSEIFGPTIQGEGLLVGQPTVFVRFGGCDYRCSWCDSLHAVLPAYTSTWERLSAAGILDRIISLSGRGPILVTLSGGNPALQRLRPLLEAGKVFGYPFHLETQGSVVRDWFSDLDYLTVSPKPPSSGHTPDPAVLFDLLARFVPQVTPQVSVKIVVMDERDYRYARDLARRLHGTYGPDLPLFFSVGNALPPQGATPGAPTTDDTFSLPDILDRMRWLWARALADGLYYVRVLPQLHTLAFGNRAGV